MFEYFNRCLKHDIRYPVGSDCPGCGFGRSVEPKIERGVPIPELAHGRRGSLQEVLLKMRRNDSVFFPGRDTRSLWEAGFRAFGKGNFTVRKVDGGARIWRL